MVNTFPLLTTINLAGLINKIHQGCQFYCRWLVLRSADEVGGKNEATRAATSRASGRSKRVQWRHCSGSLPCNTAPAMEALSRARSLQCRIYWSCNRSSLKNTVTAIPEKRPNWRHCQGYDSCSARNTTLAMRTRELQRIRELQWRLQWRSLGNCTFCSDMQKGELY